MEKGYIERNAYDFTFIPDDVNELRNIMPYRNGVSVVCPCIEDILWLHECIMRRSYFYSEKDIDDKKNNGIESTKIVRLIIFRSQEYVNVGDILFKDSLDRVRYFGDWRFLDSEIEFNAPEVLSFEAHSNQMSNDGGYVFSESEEKNFEDVFNRTFGNQFIEIDEIEIKELREHIRRKHSHLSAIPEFSVAWSFYAMSKMNVALLNLKVKTFKVKAVGFYSVEYNLPDWPDIEEQSGSGTSDESWFGGYGELVYRKRRESGGGPIYGGAGSWNFSNGIDTLGIEDSNVIFYDEGLCLKDIDKYFDVYLYVRMTSYRGSPSNCTCDVKYIRINDFVVDQDNNEFKVGSGSIFSMAQGMAGVVSFGPYEGSDEVTYIRGAFAVLIPHDDIRCDMVPESKLLDAITDNYKRE